MNNQEIFDKVATHLLTQGVPARTETLGCRYRTPRGGLKCAIGALIPDEMYDERLESQAVSDAYIPDDGDYEQALFDGTYCQSAHLGVILKTIGIDLEDKRTCNLLDELQCLHDDDEIEPGNHRKVWREKLAGIANRFKLDPAVLQTV